jgi:hypothetical protein
MKGHEPATRSVAPVGVLCARRWVCLSVYLWACLLAAAPASGARLRPITGKLDRSGLTVVALAPDGRTSTARAKPRFRVVPKARTVTLRLRDRGGRVLGPVVVEGRGSRVTLGVRAGARLGRIELRTGYARVRGRLPRRAVNRAVSAPLPGPIQEGAVGGSTPARVEAVSRSTDDDDDADIALGVAIAAAVIAAASLAWQLLALRRRRRGRIEVQVRLGLPIYPQGGGDWAVFVEVLNRTDHPVRWVSSALELSDGLRLYLMQHPPGGELPAVLKPNDSHQTWAPCHVLEQGGLQLTEPVVGTVKLDTGEVVRSARRRLVSRSRAKRFRP